MTDIVQKLRAYRPRYGWPEEYSTVVEPTMNHVAADEIERLRRERDEAMRYAENLAVALSRHFPHVPQWKPLTGDLIGLLTQIDNMTTGLSPSCAALREEKKA